MWQRSFELAMEAPKWTGKPEVKDAWEDLQAEVAAAHDLAVQQSRAGQPTWATDAERVAAEQRLDAAEQVLRERVEAAKSEREEPVRSRRATRAGGAAAAGSAGGRR